MVAHRSRERHMSAAHRWDESEELGVERRVGLEPARVSAERSRGDCVWRALVKCIWCQVQHLARAEQEAFGVLASIHLKGRVGRKERLRRRVDGKEPWRGVRS